MMKLNTFNGVPITSFLPERQAEIEKMLSAGEIGGISVSLERNANSLKKIGEIPFLEEIRVLVIQGELTPESDELKRCKRLEILSFDRVPEIIDLSLIQTLRSLTIHWSRNNITGCEKSELRSLSMWGFNPADVNDWPRFRSLQDLTLVQYKPKQISEISIYTELRGISIHYARQLSSLSGLESISIDSLILENCPKLGSYEALYKCKELEKAKIHRCGRIPNLKFVPHMSNLKSFRFMETDVDDGDLTPLLRLEDVYFTQKRHFSHKIRDFRQFRGQLGKI